MWANKHVRDPVHAVSSARPVHFEETAEEMALDETLTPADADKLQAPLIEFQTTLTASLRPRAGEPVRDAMRALMSAGFGDPVLSNAITLSAFVEEESAPRDIQAFVFRYFAIRDCHRYVLHVYVTVDADERVAPRENCPAAVAIITQVSVESRKRERSRSTYT